MALLDELVRQQLISDEQRVEVDQHAQAQATSPARAVVELGMLDADTVRGAALVASGALRTQNLAAEATTAEVTGLLTPTQARQWKVVPLRREGSTLLIAASGTTASDRGVEEDLRIALAGAPFRWMIAPPEDVAAKLDTEYRVEAELRTPAANETAVGEEQTLSPARFVEISLHQAVADGASDVHIEPMEHYTRVRVRIDGVLHVRPQAPRELHQAIINYIKNAAEMDIGDSRIPLYGGMSKVYDGRRLDLRVVTIPTVWGEKATIRLLEQTGVPAVTELGFTPANLAKWQHAYSKPEGLLVVAGPTGAGKTTTSSSTLSVLNTDEVNIWTVENPVEYRIPGLNQVQINAKAGRDYDSVLPAFMRGDPNVIFVGEIREPETAASAIQLAQTGHLVIATLHTTSAPEVATRLAELGVPAYLLGPLLECALGQRLVRRLCPDCKEPYTPSPEQLDTVGFTLPEGVDNPQQFHRPVGCARCAHIGYKGRIGIHEVMARSSNVVQAMTSGQPLNLITEAALGDGMVPLRQDGWLKAARGITTIEEVLTHTG